MEVSVAKTLGLIYLVLAKILGVNQSTTFGIRLLGVISNIGASLLTSSDPKVHSKHSFSVTACNG